MPLVDKKRILSQSPKKRLIIGFNDLKNNYNESSASDYSNLYKNESLSFILENSRMIFSEPFYGYEFYKDIISGDKEYCIFNEYKNEKDKVHSYITENSKNMSDKQKVMYEDLELLLDNKINSLKNTITMTEYALDKIDYEYFEESLSNYLYDYVNESDNEDKAYIDLSLLDLFESTDDSNIFFIYSPFVSKTINNTEIIEKLKNKYYKESFNDTEENSFKEFIENVLLLSKLSCDDIYNENVEYIPNKFTRIMFECTGKESSKNIIDEIVTEHVSNLDVYYSTPKRAVNRIFDDDIDYEIFREDNQESKNIRYGLQKQAYDILSDMILCEYQNCDNIDNKLEGYNFFESDISISDAYDNILLKEKSIIDILGEEYDEAVSEDEIKDDDISNLENEVNTKDDDDDKEVHSSKKVNAPKAKNLANKVQFKAMDAEAKQHKSAGELAQKGQEIKNAAKAVAKLPLNIIKSIKDTVNKINEKDEEKRKHYMTEPGFRKKIFRNFKLAMLYGGAAHIKLALLPITLSCRHASKEKDRRIRNELLSEIETEIKICDEKISDAGNVSDNKEKYKLMRIKAKLERERLRVRTNSRYI